MRNREVRAILLQAFWRTEAFLFAISIVVVLIAAVRYDWETALYVFLATFGVVQPFLLWANRRVLFPPKSGMH